MCVCVCVCVCVRARGFFNSYYTSRSRGLSVRQWPGRPRFNLRSSHTKDSKNGTLYLLA